MPDRVHLEVCKSGRRRCAICYGLQRDDSVKKGQLHHLDDDRSNNDPDNLVWLCFDHHDEIHSSASQSRKLTVPEVKVYRRELELRFCTWNSDSGLNQFLNFLKDEVGLMRMAGTAEKVAGMYAWYARQLALEALTQAEVQYSDPDLWVPLLATLDHFKSWGWLIYTADEREDENGDEVMHITVDHRLVCRDVAELISEREPDGPGRS